MRVRVWIGGAEGSSRDFELAEVPRTGDCVSISVGGRLEEGIVTSVTWQLVAIEASANDLLLGVDAVGSVTLVHVICESMTYGQAVSKRDDASTVAGAA